MAFIRMRLPGVKRLATLAAVLLATPVSFAEDEELPDAIPIDIVDAVVLCDSLPLKSIEGLWYYPEDRVTVLILGCEKPGCYEIFVVESEDCSLIPGEKIGELTESADPLKYRLTLFSDLKEGRLCNPIECMAVYSEKNESLNIEKPKLNIRINPLGVLPQFWRTIRMSVENPAGKLSEGMIRVYPSYDGNGSSRRQPRWL